MAYSRISPGIYRDTQTGQMIKSPMPPQAGPMPKPTMGGGGFYQGAPNAGPVQGIQPSQILPQMSSGGGWGLQQGQQIDPGFNMSNPGFKGGPQWGQPQMVQLPQGGGFGIGTPGYDGRPTPAPMNNPPQQVDRGFQRVSPGVYRNAQTGRTRLSQTKPQGILGALPQGVPVGTKVY